MHGIIVFTIALAWVAILAGSWLGWQLLRQNGRLLLRLEELEKRLNELEFGEGDEPAGLPVGREAPAFELPDLAGERQSLAQFRGQPVLLVFFNPACGYCRELAPKLAGLQGSEVRGARYEGGQQLVTSTLRTSAAEDGSAATATELTNGHPLVLILTTGDAEPNRAWFEEHKVSHPVLLQKDGEVATAYQAHGTPSGYLINPDGKIASDLAMGAEALLALAARKAEIRGAKSEADQSVHASAAGNGDDRADRFSNRSVARSKIKRDGLKAGTPAPDFRLPRLDGRGELGLEDLRGRRVLLVFSDPHCGPCQMLAPELERFHRGHPELELVMISRGEPKENRAKVKEHGLSFPIVLQQQWEISRRYAMFATPIAYLIDEAGVIAHDVAVGNDAIVELMARAVQPAEHVPVVVVNGEPVRRF